MAKKGYLYVFAGATLWGIIGIFVHGLYKLGFTPVQIVTVRAVAAAIILLFYVSFIDKKLLLVKAGDWHYFVGTGIISIVFFNLCYFTAIQQTSLSVAAVLLYTAPAFVTLLSSIFFKELLTNNKLVSLLFTFIGCMFVVGYFPFVRGGVSAFGFLVGIGSGLGYALYSIFGKFALRKYHTLTVTTYTFIFAGTAMIPASRIWNYTDLLWDGQALIYIAGLGLFPTVLAYIFYTKGLAVVESSRASIAATLEPVVATLVSVLLFGDALSVWQVFGIGLIITAVIFLQEKRKAIAA